MRPAVSILHEVADLIGDERHKEHGEATALLPEIAADWSDETGTEISSFTHCIMMARLKLRRMKHNPKNRDNLRDAIGYLALAAEFQDGH